MQICINTISFEIGAKERAYENEKLSPKFKSKKINGLFSIKKPLSQKPQKPRRRERLEVVPKRLSVEKRKALLQRRE